MTYRFELPHIGEGVVEAEIVQWLIQPGDTVVDGQAVIEVMTDKAQVEIAIDRPGTVVETMGGVGDVVPVHAVIAVLQTDGATAEVSPPQETAPTSPAAASTPSSPSPSSLSPAPARGTPAQAAARLPSAPAAAPRPVAGLPVGMPVLPSLAAQQALAPARPPGGAAVSPISGKVLASPRLRAQARSLGVPVAQLVGGLQAVAAPAAAPPSVASLPRTAALEGPANTLTWEPLADGNGPETRTKVAGLRRRIAAQMVRSKATVPHFSYCDEFDLTALEDLRKKLKPQAAEAGVKLTMLPFFMRALVKVFEEFPEVNAWYDNATGELIVKEHINMGLAVDTPRGLYVAVLRRMEGKGLFDLAREMFEVVERCRTGKATSEDLTGSTFTITSVGRFGGMFATPIINVPEVAILGLNRLEERPVVRDGQVVARTMMYVSPSFDHRVIDGAVAARFMTALKGAIENPASLL